MKTYRVFRAKGAPPLVLNDPGAQLSASVQEGTLIISSNGIAMYIFTPEQWVTVNVDPV